MDNELLLAKVCEMKHSFVAHWLKVLASRLELRAEKLPVSYWGHDYFQYMTDIHVPAEAHPFMTTDAVWPDFVGNREDEFKFKLIINNSQVWRHTLLEIGGSLLSLELFNRLNERIDYFETTLCRSRWKGTVERLKEIDVELDRLHEDRINLVGKMAASMAHEIRNPLTSIKGFLKLLRSGIRQHSLNKADTYLNYIEHECDNILMQVTGFLSFSKRSIHEEERVYITAKQVLDSNISLLNPRLINENVDLALAVPDHIKLKVQKLAIQQVLSNLLNNGIDALISLKADKRISISCYEDYAHTYIRVSNNGPRIPEEMGQRIFNPFVSDKEHGTGLGLAICKQIMTQNNGSISYTSDDQETAFLLTFYKKKEA